MTNEQTTNQSADSPIVRVRDLTDQSRMPFPRPILACGQCGTRYSAHRGDYFRASEDTPLMCCGVALVLVDRREKRAS